VDDLCRVAELVDDPVAFVQQIVQVAGVRMGVP
jgi:hypothetical protein